MGGGEWTDGRVTGDEAMARAFGARGARGAEGTCGASGAEGAGTREGAEPKRQVEPSWQMGEARQPNADRDATGDQAADQDASERDPRYAGFADEPTRAQARRIRELYRLLDVPDEEIDRVFSGVAIRDEPSYPDEEGIPVGGENPGDAVLDLCFTMWACGFDWKESFEEIVWSYEKMLQFHDMWETLDATDAAEVHAARFDEYPAEDILRYLLDLQCDEGKRVLLLDNGSDSLYTVVVRVSDLPRLRAGMRELFGPDWSILYEGGGTATLPPAPEPEPARGTTSPAGASSGAAPALGASSLARTGTTAGEAAAGGAPGAAPATAAGTGHPGGAVGAAAGRGAASGPTSGTAADDPFPFVVDSKGRTQEERRRQQAKTAAQAERAGRVAKGLGRRLVRGLVGALIGLAVALGFTLLMNFLGVERQPEQADWREMAKTAQQQQRQMEETNKRLQESLQDAQTMEFGKLPTTGGQP